MNKDEEQKKVEAFVEQAGGLVQAIELATQMEAFIAAMPERDRLDLMDALAQTLEQGDYSVTVIRGGIEAYRRRGK